MARDAMAPSSSLPSTSLSSSPLDTPKDNDDDVKSPTEAVVLSDRVQEVERGKEHMVSFLSPSCARGDLHDRVKVQDGGSSEQIKSTRNQLATSRVITSPTTSETTGPNNVTSIPTSPYYMGNNTLGGAAAAAAAAATTGNMYMIPPPPPPPPYYSMHYWSPFYGGGDAAAFAHSAPSSMYPPPMMGPGGGGPSTDANGTTAQTVVRGAGGATSTLTMTKGKEGNREKPKRPMNSFLLYAKDTRAACIKEHPTLNNKQVSKILGERWRALPKSERNGYSEKAQALLEEYRRCDSPQSDGIEGQVTFMHRGGTLGGPIGGSRKHHSQHRRSTPYAQPVMPTNYFRMPYPSHLPVGPPGYVFRDNRWEMLMQPPMQDGDGRNVHVGMPMIPGHQANNEMSQQHHHQQQLQSPSPSPMHHHHHMHQQLFHPVSAEVVEQSDLKGLIHENLTDTAKISSKSYSIDEQDNHA